MDVRNPNPLDFKFVSPGKPTAISSLRLINLTESRVIQQQFFDDLLYVKETVRPLYQNVEHRFNASGEWEEIAFARVLLPVVN